MADNNKKVPLKGDALVNKVALIIIEVRRLILELVALQKQFKTSLFRQRLFRIAQKRLEIM